MHSSMLAMTWAMFRRGRWFLLAGFLGANALPLLLLVALRADGAIDPNDPSMVIMHLVLLQLNVFTFGAAVMTAGGQVHRLYTMPLRNSQIVAGLLAPEMGLIAAQSAVSTAALNVMFDLHWPIWGPALFAAVGTAAIQAVIWLTDRSGWVVVGMGVTASLLGLWLKSRFGPAFSLPQHPWSAVSFTDAVMLAAIAAVSFAVGVAGIARNRRGEPPLSIGFIDWVNRFLLADDGRERKLNGSIAAQAWFEWTRKGLALPACVVFGMVLGLIAWGFSSRNPRELMDAFAIGGGLLSGLGIFGGMILGNLGRNDAAYGMGQFLATRPLTNSDWGWIVLRNIGRSVLITWGIWFAGYLIAYLAVRTVAPMPRFGLPENLQWWYFPATFLGCWAVTAVMAAIGLTGRLTLFLQVLVALFGGFILMSLVARYTLDSEGQRRMWQITLTILGVLAILGTAAMFALAKRRNILGTPVVAMAAALFALGTLAVVVLGRSPDAVPRFVLAAPIGLIAIALAPVAAAPLATAINRTR